MIHKIDKTIAYNLYKNIILKCCKINKIHIPDLENDKDILDEKILFLRNSVFKQAYPKFKCWHSL